MTKLQFLLSLHDRLANLPQEDVEDQLNFYIEMIEDRMEEGLSEAEAVAAVGTVEEIAAQISENISPSHTAERTASPAKGNRTWELALLILSFPLWFPLLIAAFSVVLSLYIALWSMIISLWAVFASLVACTIGGIAAGVGFILGGNSLSGVAMIGAGIFCAGLSIFLFFGCRAATKGTLRLTKSLFIGFINRLRKKEDV